MDNEIFKQNNADQVKGSGKIIYINTQTTLKV